MEKSFTFRLTFCVEYLLIYYSLRDDRVTLNFELRSLNCLIVFLASVMVLVYTKYLERKLCNFEITNYKALHCILLSPNRLFDKNFDFS
jgi:hypothetical protein